jgi:hypothetical protein
VDYARQTGARVVVRGLRVGADFEYELQIAHANADLAPELDTLFLPTRTGDGSKIKHYYPAESTGLATGLLITALHRAGLACLTHTPSPMKFLNEILDRPPTERPFLLLVTGYPADGAMVPGIHRKELSDYVSFVSD